MAPDDRPAGSIVAACRRRVVPPGVDAGFPRRATCAQPVSHPGTVHRRNSLGTPTAGPALFRRGSHHGPRRATSRHPVPYVQQCPGSPNNPRKLGPAANLIANRFVSFSGQCGGSEPNNLDTFALFVPKSHHCGQPTPDSSTIAWCLPAIISRRSGKDGLSRS